MAGGDDDLETHLDLFLGRQDARFVFQHHRDIVADRVSQTAGLADEFLLRLFVMQWSLADRAHQYL
jgi:hypothetical protein